MALASFCMWRAGFFLKKTRETGALKLNCSLSAQYPFSAVGSVFVFHRCQSHHGSTFQASVMTPGRKKNSSGMSEGRLENVWWRE